MIRYLLWFYLYHLLLLANTKAEPLKGYNILPAKPREFPFLASLGHKYLNNLDDRKHFCTGSLITKKYVLTAAHCFLNLSINAIEVTVGEVNLRKAALKYDVYSWITYEEWALKRRKPIKFQLNDVAMVKLSSAVNAIGIVPVSITNLNAKQLHRTTAVIAGWGTTNEGNDADLLKKANVTIITPQKCEDNIRLVSNMLIAVPENYICTMSEPYSLVDCGDSGGPLLDQNNVLLGIIGGSCPNDQWGNFHPDFINRYLVNVHLDVNYYIDFIEDVAHINARLQLNF